MNRNRSLASFALVVAFAATLPAPAAVVADETGGVCDIKVTVGDGPDEDERADIRLFEEFVVHGFGFPADTTLTIEFYSGVLPTQFFETTTTADGAFIESFVYEGEDPVEPEYWLLSVYDPADLGSCIDFLDLWIHPATPFTDIDGNPFRMDIIWLYQSGITAGCAPTLFCPDGTVTREQMAAFLDRALGLSSTNLDFFTDDESSLFEKEINRLAASGITKGCTATTFCPKLTITREQMAAFLDRALSLDATDTDFFTDDASSIFEKSINRMAASGITTGCGGTNFCPKGLVTRGQMAAFLHRAFGSLAISGDASWDAFESGEASPVGR